MFDLKTRAILHLIWYTVLNTVNSLLILYNREKEE